MAEELNLYYLKLEGLSYVVGVCLSEGGGKHTHTLAVLL